MKIAFVGKGGSGKTTLASLFVRQLVAQHRPVLAIDADINQHLAAALGATEEVAAGLPTLGAHLPAIKEYLRGANPRITQSAAMIKTTPPGAGSRLLTITENNPIYAACVRDVGGARLAVTGPFGEGDLGVACYHSKVGAVELLLNHLVDGPDEYVVVDMTAGADAFASGLFTRFDLTVLVCEPTVRSVGVYRQYRNYARDFGVRIAVVGNKISDSEDVGFLASAIDGDLIATVDRSQHVRAAERGNIRPITELEPTNQAALDTIRATLDSVDKDWPTYQQQANDFHRRNAQAWGDAKVGSGAPGSLGAPGSSLADQIDPGFTLGPAALALAGRTPQLTP